MCGSSGAAVTLTTRSSGAVNNQFSDQHRSLQLCGFFSEIAQYQKS